MKKNSDLHPSLFISQHGILFVRANDLLFLAGESMGEVSTQCRLPKKKTYISSPKSGELSGKYNTSFWLQAYGCGHNCSHHIKARMK